MTGQSASKAWLVKQQFEDHVCGEATLSGQSIEIYTDLQRTTGHKTLMQMHLHGRVRISSGTGHRTQVVML